MSRTTISACLLLCLLLRPPGMAQATAYDLSAMSLEQLMEVEVSLTSRTETPLFETPAATFVLTRDDIRRSAARSLPELLRLVPGMQVARIDGSRWAVSARGFGHRFANKLLVLLDGRHVYSPYFAGVFWEVADVDVDEIERIEVVRGPGGTLWGANAVNGIVNVVTRPAGDSPGLDVHALHGVDRADRSLSVRQGGAAPVGGAYRVHASYAGQDAFTDATGSDADDSWEKRELGLRADWEGADDDVSLRAGVYDDRIPENLPVQQPSGSLARESREATHAGGHVLASWHRRLAGGSSMRLQGYYDRYERDHGVVELTSEALDLDFQQRLRPARGIALTWGAAYRRTRDKAGIELPFRDPDSEVVSAFLHADVAVDGLHLSLGTKMEHNEYSGWETQPSARLLWQASGRQVLWGAATRAVRTPALSDFVPRFAREGGPPPGGGFPSGGFGGPRGKGVQFPSFEVPEVDSETVRSLESGYRLRVARGVTLDAAVYVNDYERLRLIPFIPPELLSLVIGGAPRDSAGPPSGLPEAVLGAQSEDVTTYGGEIVAEWQVSRARLRGSYARIDFDMRDDAPRPAGTVSEQRVTLWPSVDVSESMQLDAILYYVDPLDDVGAGEADGATLAFRSALAGYTDLDLRLAWRFRDDAELALSGRNLLHEHRPEFAGFVFDSRVTEVPRSVAVSLRWSR
jgi:iron complex outermembrane receptor protein